MANPSKQKGTGGETELVKLLDQFGIFTARTSPSTKWDLVRLGPNNKDAMPALATRPDRGEWLVTLSLHDYAALVRFADIQTGKDTPLRIEVKRYKRFSLHSIWQEKFGA